MKYVIWGAGQRGKKAIEIIKKENILFFVDTDLKKIGENIEGIEIKGINSILECKDEFIILITPIDYAASIVEYLKQIGSNNYFVFEECPLGIELSENSEPLDELYDFSLNYKIVAIDGITWFSLYLYKILYKQGIETYIFCDESKTHLCELVSKEYDMITNLKGLEKIECVLTSENRKSKFNEKYLCIDSYIEKSYKKNNPEILKYRGLHSGKRCFIIATGPSLLVSDLDKLNEKQEICISMNRIYNIFDRTLWRPDYYMIEDQKMIEDLAYEIAELDIENKFVQGNPQKYWELDKAKNSIRFNVITQSCLTDTIGFSENAERFIYDGYTVTYGCLQLAIYMGFTDIYLLGVDFNYTKDVYAECNHFAGYQRHYKDIRLNPIHPEKMLRAYKKALQIAKSKGINIYNATRGGKLEVFERIDFDKIWE